MIVQGIDYEHTLDFPTEPSLRYQVTGLGPLTRTILTGEPFEAAEFSLAAAMILADREPLRLP